MQLLTMILATIFIVLLILDYLKNLTIKTSIQIVNEMGIGYNLGYSFDSYLLQRKINSTDDAITLMGNPIPTRNLITNIKKYGFKTIRFPVTWIYFTDQYGNINPEWILRVKEVVKWIIEKDMYCILNLYTDTPEWIRGIESKSKYINIWKQIAEEFKDYNEYLIFESMNGPIFYTSNYNYNYDLLLNFTQSFVDTIRNSERFNKERLLIISGMGSNLALTCTEKYKMPRFTMNGELWYGFDKWGSPDEYKELLQTFVTLNDFYVSKGIPVVIGEVGVITEANKELSSIREYLYSFFSLANEYKGIIACNYYNRLTDEWYDDKIKNIFKKISKGQFVKSSDFYIYSNLEIITQTEEYSSNRIVFGSKKPLQMILNLDYIGKLFSDYYFEIYCIDSYLWDIFIKFDEKNGKKQYDGTITYTIDVSNLDCHESFSILYYFGEIYFKKIIIEYQENFTSFYYSDFKAKIISEIN